ncbi:unnamed protein product [Mytilus coruscus]|uniref:Uncharacterized protein n=1 Tax=Mytilus coruscus TaxID=42192 RepID=A0A6J8CSJ2_MYTCO|nr:unnamed protein product [Mytilus coruscus]
MNKLIRITNKSPPGWSIVREYESYDLASVTEEEKRFLQAEKRAIKTIKEKKNHVSSTGRWSEEIMPQSETRNNLAKCLPDYCLHSTADKTEKKYRYAFDSFSKWYSLTQNISMALYRYLCHSIVGSEDHVKSIRLMNTISYNLSIDNLTTVITSGSFGEGLDMKGSDLDLMFVCKGIEVYEDVKPRLNTSITYFQ